MAYGTLANFKTWLGQNISSSNPGQYDQLTDKVSFATLDDTVGQNALDRSSSLIDSYIGKQYTVPITTSPTPDVLILREFQLAAWDLITSSGANRQLEQFGRFRAMQDDAMNWIKDVASGEACIPGVTLKAGADTDSRAQVFKENLTSVI